MNKCSDEDDCPTCGGWLAFNEDNEKLLKCTSCGQQYWVNHWDKGEDYDGEG